MDGGSDYRPRTESPANPDDENSLNDVVVKIAPDEMNGVPYAKRAAADDTAENNDER